MELELESKYIYVVNAIRREIFPQKYEVVELMDNYSKHLIELSTQWYGNASQYNIFRTFERIHSADDVIFGKHKYLWKFKSDKIVNNYVSLIEDNIQLTFFEEKATKITESDLKYLLMGSGIPIEAFDKIDSEETL